jgi:hypothetical protein
MSPISKSGPAPQISRSEGSRVTARAAERAAAGFGVPLDVDLCTFRAGPAQLDVDLCTEMAPTAAQIRIQRPGVALGSAQIRIQRPGVAFGSAQIRIQ